MVHCETNNAVLLTWNKIYIARECRWKKPDGDSQDNQGNVHSWVGFGVHWCQNSESTSPPPNRTTSKRCNLLGFSSSCHYNRTRPEKMLRHLPLPTPNIPRDMLFQVAILQEHCPHTWQPGEFYDIRDRLVAEANPQTNTFSSLIFWFHLTRAQTLASGMCVCVCVCVLPNPAGFRAVFNHTINTLCPFHVYNCKCRDNKSQLCGITYHYYSSCKTTYTPIALVSSYLLLR